jgi:soluble lytic murein transglycosylase-like protein
MRPAGVFGHAFGIATAAAAMSLLSWLATPASADVYYYKDADGVYHFTNVARPDATPFIVDRPLAQLPTATLVDRRVPDSDDYDPIIDRFAKRFRVESALVKAVIRAESGFNRLAVSSAGARGLMQLMPDTARRHGVRNIYDPEQNIEGGVRHLRLLLDRHRNNLPSVLAAYNAGSDVVDRYHGIPPIAETQDYVARVLRFRQQYLKRGARASEVARSS